MKFMVAFSSPKRSSRTIEIAASHAKALGAELILLKIVADPQKVGIIAELIATDRPINKAQEQVDQAISQLKEQGIKASGQVRVGEVAPGIIAAAEESGADMLFVGTTIPSKTPLFLMERDPIIHYLVSRCPIPLCLIRSEPVSDPEA